MQCKDFVGLAFVLLWLKLPFSACKCGITDCCYLDIIYVVEGSNYINGNDMERFQNMKEFILETSSMFKSKFGKGTQLSVHQRLTIEQRDSYHDYEPTVKTLSETSTALGECKDYRCFRDRVLNMNTLYVNEIFPATTSLVYLGVQFAAKHFGRSRQSGSLKHIIYISDAPFDDLPDMTNETANFLHEQHIAVTVIAIRNFDIETLSTIVGADHVLSARSHQQFVSIDFLKAAKAKIAANVVDNCCQIRKKLDAASPEIPAPCPYTTQKDRVSGILSTTVPPKPRFGAFKANSMKSSYNFRTVAKFAAVLICLFTTFAMTMHHWVERLESKINPGFFPCLPFVDLTRKYMPVFASSTHEILGRVLPVRSVSHQSVNEEDMPEDEWSCFPSQTVHDHHWSTSPGKVFAPKWSSPCENVQEQWSATPSISRPNQTVTEQWEALAHQNTNKQLSAPPGQNLANDWSSQLPAADLSEQWSASLGQTQAVSWRLSPGQINPKEWSSSPLKSSPNEWSSTLPVDQNISRQWSPVLEQISVEKFPLETTILFTTAEQTVPFEPQMSEPSICQLEDKMQQTSEMSFCSKSIPVKKNLEDKIIQTLQTVASHAGNPPFSVEKKSKELQTSEHSIFCGYNHQKKIQKNHSSEQCFQSSLQIKSSRDKMSNSKQNFLSGYINSINSNVKKKNLSAISTHIIPGYKREPKSSRRSMAEEKASHSHVCKAEKNPSSINQEISTWKRRSKHIQEKTSSSSASLSPARSRPKLSISKTLPHQAMSCGSIAVTEKGVKQSSHYSSQFTFDGLSELKSSISAVALKLDWSMSEVQMMVDDKLSALHSAINISMNSIPTLQPSIAERFSDLLHIRIPGSPFAQRPKSAKPTPSSSSRITNDLVSQHVVESRYMLAEGVRSSTSSIMPASITCSESAESSLPVSSSSATALNCRFNWFGHKLMGGKA